MAATSIGIVTPIQRGRYDATATYNRLNIVLGDNAVYMCKKTCTGVPLNNTEFFEQWVVGGGASGGSADLITYDNISSGLNAGNVQDAIDEVVVDKANKWETDTTLNTLLAISWNGASAPYSYDLNIGSEYDVEVLIPKTITNEQYEAYVSAQISSNGTDNLLLAWGDKPTIDLPIVVRKVVK